MENELYILVSSSTGSTRHFVFAKKTVQGILVFVLVVLSFFCIFSLFGISSFNVSYRQYKEVNQLKDDLQNAIAQNISLQNSLNLQREENSKIKEIYQNRIQEIVDNHSEEQEILLKGAVNDLHSRSLEIENILTMIGLEIDDDLINGQQNKGGPFTSLSDEDYEDLIFKSGFFLDTIRPIPLGSPVLGKLTSNFGRRIDPFNNKPAFHKGVDIKGDPGTDIMATANGKVKESGYTKGYGRYILLDHENGFQTMFAHLKKRLVRQGDSVNRGQIIGLMGNSGRSSGTHLHYEIRYRNKLIDPVKYVNIIKKTI